MGVVKWSLTHITGSSCAHTWVLSAEKTEDPTSHSLVLGTGYATLGVCSNQDCVSGGGRGEAWGEPVLQALGVVRYYASHWLGCAVPQMLFANPGHFRVWCPSAFFGNCSKPFSALGGEMGLKKACD